MGYKASLVFPGSQPGMNGSIRAGSASKSMNGVSFAMQATLDRFNPPKENPDERFNTTYRATVQSAHMTIKRPTSNPLRFAGERSFSGREGQPTLSMRSFPSPAQSGVPQGGSGLDESQSPGGHRAPPLPPGGLNKAASAPRLQIQGFNADGMHIPSSRMESQRSSGSRNAFRAPRPDSTMMDRDELRTRAFETKAKRRNMLETLADPNVEKKARAFFRRYDTDNSGRLEFPEMNEVMKALELEHGIPVPKPDVLERLIKKYDTDNDACLKFEEFYDMLISALRIQAFDHSTVHDREFFVTKQRGDVWKKYSKVKEMGSGTFGTAFLAKHRGTQEERVIKAVRKGRAKIPIEEIEREIILMRQVDHPHIVRLFEWFEDNRRIYLVMESLKGGTLQKIVLDFVKKKKTLNEDWIRSVTRQSIEAMAYCHGLRLIHKDIKDENIMLLKKDPDFSDPFVVIIDLGVAEMFSVADPACHEIGGSPATIAPEVWRGNFGPKCDVWSLGCVLFEMLAGAMPFMTRTIQADAWLKLHKRGPDWKLCKASSVSRDLCKQMLTYVEEKRPTMRELLQHEWFEAGDGTFRDHVDAEQFGPLVKYVEESALKRNLLLQMASSLPMGEAGNIHKIFEAVDKNRDGSLTAEELREAFRRMGLTHDENFEEIWNALDVDGDGTLSFTEFAAAMLFLCKDILEERLYAMFYEYDTDHNGLLDREEAKEFLSSATMLLKEDADQAEARNLLRDLLPKRGEHINFETLKEALLAPKSIDRERERNSRQSSARLASSRAALGL